jgi:hypothetical protein
MKTTLPPPEHGRIHILGYFRCNHATHNATPQAEFVQHGRMHDLLGVFVEELFAPFDQAVLARRETIKCLVPPFVYISDCCQWGNKRRKFMMTRLVTKTNKTRKINYLEVVHFIGLGSLTKCQH